MSSKHNVTLEANINTKINHSKAGVSTTPSTICRICVHLRPTFVFMHFSKQMHLETKARVIYYYLNYRVLPVVNLMRETIWWLLRRFVLPKSREVTHAVDVLAFGIPSTSHCKFVNVWHEGLPGTFALSIRTRFLFGGVLLFSGT